MPALSLILRASSIQGASETTRRVKGPSASNAAISSRFLRIAIFSRFDIVNETGGRCLLLHFGRRIIIVTLEPGKGQPLACGRDEDIEALGERDGALGQCVFSGQPNILRRNASSSSRRWRRVSWSADALPLPFV